MRWRGVSYAILLKGDEACLGWVGHATKRLALEDVDTVGRLGEVTGEEVGVGVVPCRVDVLVGVDQAVGIGREHTQGDPEAEAEARGGEDGKRADETHLVRSLSRDELWSEGCPGEGCWDGFLSSALETGMATLLSST